MANLLLCFVTCLMRLHGLMPCRASTCEPRQLGAGGLGHSGLGALPQCHVLVGVLLQRCYEGLGCGASAVIRLGWWTVRRVVIQCGGRSWAARDMKVLGFPEVFEGVSLKW